VYVFPLQFLVAVVHQNLTHKYHGSSIQGRLRIRLKLAAHSFLQRKFLTGLSQLFPLSPPFLHSLPTRYSSS